ncbi:tetratricopeptide repeat protein [Hathewaya histolytica]|uniref:Tpr-repeat-containing protein n=1 Tax=Hathewaya histolytica TaxID=1498 RepID=A0A4U9QX80_HATHI|nr:tetratricopeptide repeat protein [Hathewaya histolytica]VTQ83079.1 tpr-repeat-containing protein [Hathewaya histolytica]
MSKANKVYKKVLNYYHKGHLEKAINLCESLGDDINSNNNLLNFNGILYYLKGDMNKARNLWNINYRNNKDEISRKYLADSIKDEEYATLYGEALHYIEGFQISKSIERLKLCKEKTNFNTINVNNELSKCYIKKADYKNALMCMDEVLKLDNKNEIALQNKQSLSDLGIIPKDSKLNIHKKKMYIPLVVILLFICSSLFYKFMLLPNNNIAKEKKNVEVSKEKHTIKNGEDIKKENSKIDKKRDDKNLEHEKANSNKKINTENSKEKAQNVNKKTSEHKKDSFPKENIKASIDGEKFDDLDQVLRNWKREELDVNDKMFFNEAIEFMNKGAGEYYYFKGRDLSKQGNFNEAIKYYSKGISYGVGKFPYEDGLYMLGVAYKKVGNTKEALKIYERYYTEYKEKNYVKNGSYLKDVLYYLRDTYKNLNDEKYRVFEKELKKLG